MTKEEKKILMNAVSRILKEVDKVEHREDVEYQSDLFYEINKVACMCIRVKDMVDFMGEED